MEITSNDHGKSMNSILRVGRHEEWSPSDADALGRAAPAKFLAADASSLATDAFSNGSGCAGGRTAADALAAAGALAAAAAAVMLVFVVMIAVVVAVMVTVVIGVVAPAEERPVALFTAAAAATAVFTSESRSS